MGEGRAQASQAQPLRYCLDTWPIIDWLEDREPAASRVEEILPRRPLMSWINLGEVAYIAEQRWGKEASVEVVENLERALLLDLPTRERVLAAAALKAAHRISYADGFAIATAIAHNAVLLTGDPDILAGDPSWPVESLLP